MWLTKKGYQKHTALDTQTFQKKNDTKSDRHRVLQISTKTISNLSREHPRVSTPSLSFRQNINF